MKKMGQDIEQSLLREIERLKRELILLKGRNAARLPTYQYGALLNNELLKLLDIKQNRDETRFDEWFCQAVAIDHATECFLTELLDENKVLIEWYSEEDLKVNVIVPLLNRVRFKSFDKKIRDFYELPLVYATEKFIFSGTVDFAVAEGLIESRKPYFFLQEFRHSQDCGHPRLLGELISAVELNEWMEIKGAYIVGGKWHFVILEKLASKKYQYFISQGFDLTKLDDIKSIYRNLVVVRNEILARTG